MTQFPALASIQDAAKLLNVSTKTLRRWESRGVLVPIRTSGGHRRYELTQLKEFKLKGKRVRVASVAAPQLSKFGHFTHNHTEPEPPEVGHPSLIPSIKDVPVQAPSIPVLYEGLHINQKKVLGIISTAIIFALSSYVVIKSVPTKEILGQSMPKDIAVSGLKGAEGSVLAAATSSVSPIFNLNIQSSFNDNSLFTKDVEVDGILTLKGKIIGDANISGVAVVGGNSITTNQNIFNLINSTAGTLNIGGAATAINVGATTGTTTINNNLIVKGTEGVTGKITGSSDLAITGNSVIGGTETVTGKLTASGDFSVSGATTLSGAETVSGKITGSSDLAISGNGTFGNITSINGVTYSFPTTQGAASTMLTNNGSGTLSWQAPNIASLSGVLSFTGGGTNNSTAYTAGSVIFSDGSKLTQDNSNFFYDATNHRLGIGNVAPGVALDVTGAGKFSSGLTLTTGAINLTSTSGSTNLTSTGTSGSSFAFTNNSLTANNSNLANLTFTNANTSAGVTVNGLSITGVGSTPSSSTNIENLIYLSGTTLGSNTFNGITFDTGLSNYISGANFTVTAAGAETIASDLAVNGGNITTNQTSATLFNTAATTLNIGGAATTLKIGNTGGTTTINNALAVTGATSLNGNSTFGSGSGNTLTFTGRVNSNILPSVTGTDDFGSTALKWNNVYALSYNQNGNLVCDSSGANCPAGNNQYWNQAAGAVFPINSSVDLLIGANSTGSAKFAFTGVNSGTPTASIAGTVANVATYLTGNGNLATTNTANLTIGGSTSGNITLNPSNSIAGGFVAPNTNNVTDLGTSALIWRNIYGGQLPQQLLPKVEMQFVTVREPIVLLPEAVEVSGI